MKNTFEIDNIAGVVDDISIIVELLSIPNIRTLQRCQPHYGKVSNNSLNVELRNIINCEIFEKIFEKYDRNFAV